MACAQTFAITAAREDAFTRDEWELVDLVRALRLTKSEAIRRLTTPSSASTFRPPGRATVHALPSASRAASAPRAGSGRLRGSGR